MIRFGSDVTEFIRDVARGTGLREDVIAGWVVAENSDPSHPTTARNPLNIRNGPKGSFRPYPSMKAAAAATVSTLHNGRYGPVLKAARTNDPRAQLNAIAMSPWDAGHYGGNGKNLFGAYKRVTSAIPSLKTATPQGDPFQGADTSVSDAAHQLNPATWIGGVESWLEGAALRALAYVVLTVAAIALFVLGLERTLGPSPFTRAMPYNPRVAPIPF